MSIYGLRQVGTGRCPRRLVGRGHRGAGGWCGTRLNDHGTTWADPEGRKAVVWQPYDADGVELAEVIRHAEADGLDVAVTGASAHYPGGTFAVVFRVAFDVTTRSPRLADGSTGAA